MNLRWKKTETPLNLIQILPDDGEKSQTTISHDLNNAQHLRIQVGDEVPSVSLELLSTTLAFLRKGLQRLAGILKTSGTLCQRACIGIVGGLKSCMTYLFLVLRKGGSWSSDVVVNVSHAIQQHSRKHWHVLKKNKKRELESKVDIVSPTAESKSIESKAIKYPTKLETDELLWEVHALRDQLTAQKSELTRVNVQIGELKALALSQQQVLLHLGKEIESIEPKTGRAEKATPKKIKPRASKAAKSKPHPSSSPPSTEASMRLDPQR